MIKNRRELLIEIINDRIRSSLSTGDDYIEIFMSKFEYDRLKDEMDAKRYEVSFLEEGDYVTVSRMAIKL